MARLPPVLQVPLGVGLGLYHKIKKDGHVSIVQYGDGAANQGQIAEVQRASELHARSQIQGTRHDHQHMAASGPSHMGAGSC